MDRQTDRQTYRQGQILMPPDYRHEGITKSSLPISFVTGDETWVNYFEPVRKVSNKILATKLSKRPIIAKSSLSAKKVLFASP